MISLIFPHADNRENNETLSLKRRMLEENTTCPYQLLYLSGAQPQDVYKFWNDGFRMAKFDICIWDNSDIVYADRWNEPILKHINDADWLCFRLVECGAIPVADSNIHRDFGRTAATFDRAGFEAFAAEEAKRHLSIEHGKFGWYSPSAFRKDWFLASGGFPTEKPFPHDNDREFRERVTKQGCRFALLPGAVAYHFQFARRNLPDADWLRENDPFVMQIADELSAATRNDKDPWVYNHRGQNHGCLTAAILKKIQEHFRTDRRQLPWYVAGIDGNKIPLNEYVSERENMRECPERE